MFINSILLDTEAWCNVTSKTINELKKMDNLLLRNITNSISTVPTVFLHLELGTIPLKFIWQSRRLMYLHYLLHENTDSMVSQVLSAQIVNPLKCVWWLLAKSDLEDLNVNLSLHQIRNTSKYTFRKLIRYAIEDKAFKWLLEHKSTLSKI